MKRVQENRLLLSWDARRRWAIQLISAVQSLHAAGFVHEHLTLDTIFLVPSSSLPAQDPQGSVAFRNILVSCPTITSQSSWPDVYTSPEILECHSSTPQRFNLSTQSDLYSLGVILEALAVQDCEPALYTRS